MVLEYWERRAKGLCYDCCEKSVRAGYCKKHWVKHNVNASRAAKRLRAKRAAKYGCMHNSPAGTRCSMEKALKKFGKVLSPKTARAFVLDGAVLEKRLDELMKEKQLDGIVRNKSDARTNRMVKAWLKK